MSDALLATAPFAFALLVQRPCPTHGAIDADAAMPIDGLPIMPRIGGIRIGRIIAPTDAIAPKGHDIQIAGTNKKGEDCVIEAA